MTTVVLPDDHHAVVRDGLGALLEPQFDISVVGDAANGRLAVQLHLDVVVIGIAMPDLNGIEAVQQIRDACPSAQAHRHCEVGTRGA